VSVICNYRVWVGPTIADLHSLYCLVSHLFSPLHHLCECNMQLYTVITDPMITDSCSPHCEFVPCSDSMCNSGNCLQSPPTPSGGCRHVSKGLCWIIATWRHGVPYLQVTSPTMFPISNTAIYFYCLLSCHCLSYDVCGCFATVELCI